MRIPVERELLNKQTRQLLAIKAGMFVRIPLKESCLQEWGRSSYSLSSAVTLSYPFNVQGNVCTSRTGQPVAPRYSIPHLVAARLPACRCVPGGTSCLLGAWSRCGRGRAEVGEGTAHFQGRNIWEEEEGRVNGEVLMLPAVSLQSQKPLAVVSPVPARRGVI